MSGDVDFSPDGLYVASAGVDGVIRRWNLSSSALEMSYAGHRSGIWAVAFSPNGERLYSTSADGTARVWDVSAGTMVADISERSGEFWGLAVSPDGQTFATTSLNGATRICASKTGYVLRTLGIAASDAIDWDGHRLIVAAGRSWAVIELLPDQF